MRPSPSDTAFQATLELGVPLSEVTFCVVDLETTGGSPTDSRITEIGAVKYRGGERIGSFQSLVNPRQPIPRFITHLTGIDDRLLAGEAGIEAVLPTFLEFARGCSFVAHNASFDFSFLAAEADRLDYEPLRGPPICTAKLARRVVWPDVPNVRLQTLSQYFRTRSKPVHRALEDAETCAEVLQGLLDMAERLGIRTLGDLNEACRARGRPNYGKIRLADELPAGPGVYLFRARDGSVIYVGKSKNLRARVRSYFYGDERKKVQNLLDEVTSVEGIQTPAGELEALVAEARLIRKYEPRYNRHGKRWRRSAYLKLDPYEAYPRLKVVYKVKQPSDALVLGPFPNSSRARLAKEAIEEVVPIRRCTRSMGARTRFAPCALADIGRCAAPCDGRIDPERYGELVRGLASSLRAPAGLLEALGQRMSSLADQERFEEAAQSRDRLRALAEALWRARQDRWLVEAGWMSLRTQEGGLLKFDHGALARAAGTPAEPIGLPCPRERADELSAVRSWIARNTTRIETCDGPLAEPVAGGRELADVLRRLREAGKRDNDSNGQPAGQAAARSRPYP